MIIDISKIYAHHKLIESTIIISVGLFMHLNRISVIELKYTRLPMLTPNVASTLFVFSVLCILAKLRPLWPNALRKPQQLLIFVVELSLILYATDFLLRQVWLPSLKLLNFVCRFLGQYVIVANEAFLANNAPRLSSWIRNDAFYIARFLLALIAFIFMMDTTGILDLFSSRLCTRSGAVAFFRKDNDTVDVDIIEVDEPVSDSEDAPSASSPDIISQNFNVNDLPYVPQEDLLNLGHRVGSRRRRQPMRKVKRPKMLLNQLDNECSC